MRKNTLNPELTPAIFAALRKKARSDAERRRFQALEFLASGLDRKFINDSLGLGRNTLGSWVAKANSSGPGAFFTAPGQGPHHKLSGEQRLQIIEEVKRSPRALGFKQSNWDGRLIRRRILSAFGIECSLGTVYNILKRGGISKQRPTRLYGECDEKTKEDFKKKSGR